MLVVYGGLSAQCENKSHVLRSSSHMICEEGDEERKIRKKNKKKEMKRWCWILREDNNL